MKTKIYLLGGWLVFLSYVVFPQGIINQSSNIGLQGNVVVYIATNNQGHYTSNGTGRIKVYKTTSTPTIDVFGNWINNAGNTGFYNDSSNVRLLATANQTIGGTSPTTFYNLILGGSGIKTLTNNVNVGGQTQLNGTLDLTSVELNLNQYTLSITNPNMNIAYTTGYINSENGCGTCNIWSSVVTWSATPNITRTIPFGVSSTQIPVTFNKTAGPAVNISFSTRQSGLANNTPVPSTVTAMNVPAMSIAQTNDGTNTVIDRWWYITPNTTSATPVTLDLNFTYRGAAENSCTGCPQSGNFGAQYWVEYSATNKGWLPCAGPTWVCSTLGTWSGVTAGTQGATATTGGVPLPNGANPTSYWVLSCTAKPLPVELVSFTAMCQKNNSTLLQWKTASEVNADKFDVQKSTNGVDYVSIATVPAQYPYGGEYAYTDNSKNTGIVYYRLKMTDKDGSFKYSSITDVDFNKCNNIRTQLYAYGRDIMINIQANNSQKIYLMLYDALGRVMLQKELEVQEGANNFQIPANIAQSIYFAKLSDERGNVIQIEKVIVSD